MGINQNSSSSLGVSTVQDFDHR